MDKRYGIIGCGMMGLEHINNINLLEGVHVHGVYDPVRELAENASVRAKGARIAESIEALVSHGDLDALVIVSPNNKHVENIEEIAKYVTLPILCEKPLYSHAVDAPRLTAVLETYDAPVWVAMEYRYMPPIARVIREADTVTGGVKMLTIREHRFAFLPKIGDWNRFNANSGGTFVEKCCHFFDLMRLILKSEPTQVAASAGQITNHLDEVYDGQTSDIWDGGYVIVDFENGARAMLELCMFADGSLWNEEISAVGPKGKMECRLPGPSRFWPEALGAPPHPQVTIAPRSPKNPQTVDVEIDAALLEAGDHHGSTFYQHQKFLDVVKGIGEVAVTVDDGRMAVKMGLAAQRAARDGRVVKMTDV